MRLIVLFVALLCAPAAAFADGDALVTRDEVTRAAFAPSTFFPELQGHEDEVRITYVADDWRWPFWSIAIRRGCLDRERGRLQGECANRWTARMVRAPGADTDRPRARALAMVSRIAATRAVDANTTLPDSLDADGLHWLEARIDLCPGATQIFIATDGLSWNRFESLSSGEMSAIILHADHVSVAFHTLHTEATYDGPISAGTPAEWGVTLYNALQSCWGPATDPPPWRSSNSPRP